jgi:hypothetical protein
MFRTVWTCRRHWGQPIKTVNIVLVNVEVHRVLRAETARSCLRESARGHDDAGARVRCLPGTSPVLALQSPMETHVVSLITVHACIGSARSGSSSKPSNVANLLAIVLQAIPGVVVARLRRAAAPWLRPLDLRFRTVGRAASARRVGSNGLAIRFWPSRRMGRYHTPWRTVVNHSRRVAVSYLETRADRSRPGV